MDQVFQLAIPGDILLAYECVGKKEPNPPLYIPKTDLFNRKLRWESGRQNYYWPDIVGKTIAPDLEMREQGVPFP